MGRQAMFLALCLWGLRALAADAVVQGPPPSWVKPPSLPAQAPPDEAPARLLLRSYQLRFTPGSSEMYVENFIRVQTPEGLRAMGNVTLPWKPDTDVLTVHKVRLLRGERVIDLLADGQKFEVLRRENNLEYAALDGVLTAALQPAGMEVGDIVNLAFTLRRESSLIPMTELALFDLAQLPAKRLELRASWETGTALRWRASEDVKGAREQRAGAGRELVWNVDNLEPLRQPTNVPARFWRFPLIEFSTYRSWNDVSRVLAPLYAKAATLAAESPLKAEARAIAAASTDPVARIEAALRLSQDRVRYVFLGMGDGNLNPASADTTWERRFGDCKGKTVLLIALLRELGIESEAVLVSTRGGDALEGRLPALGAFDHVMVRARVDGHTYWLDGAGSGSWRRGDLVTPNYYWGLPLSVHGETLAPMRAEPAAEPSLVTSTEIDAHEGLFIDAPFKAEVRIRGAAAAMLRAQLAQLTPANREPGLRDYWKSQYDFVEPKTVTSEFDENTGVMVLRMQGTAVMDWGGFRYTTDGMRVGWRVDFAREPGINADAPFVLEHPEYSVTRQRIVLPAGASFTTDGADYELTLAGHRYSRHSRITERVFTGEVISRSLQPEISAQEARAAEKQLNDMWKDRLDIVTKGYRATDADISALRKRKYTERADLVWRGNLFLDRGDYDAAFTDFEAAVQADPKSASALAHRGLAHYWKRRSKEARADFDAALVLDAQNAVALRGIGALLRDRRDYRGAIDSFSRSLRSDPDNTFALAYRAYAHSMLEENDAALADAATVIRLQPTYLEMYDLRAWLLTARGEEAKALAELDAMFAANPDNLRAHWLASHNYSRLGRYADAVRSMDKMVLDKPSVANYRKRAEVRDPADVAGRLADIDAGLALDADSVDLQYLRAEVLAQSGDHKAAADIYGRRLVKERGLTEQRRLHILRGLELYKLGDKLTAHQELNAALADGADGDSYNHFCWYVGVARVELESALAACDKAISFAPKDAAYLDSRGLVLLQLGRLDEAVASYDAALAQKPSLPASLYGRGIAKKRRCQCTDGDADLRAGARGDPAVKRMFAEAGLQP